MWEFIRRFKYAISALVIAVAVALGAPKSVVEPIVDVGIELLSDDDATPLPGAVSPPCAATDITQ